MQWGRINGSMLTRLDAEPNNGFLAKRFGGLQPVQTLDQDEACSVGPHQDRGRLARVEHTRCDLAYAPLLDSRAPFDRYVDVSDRKRFALQHT